MYKDKILACTVTQKHITEGVKASCHRCPGALAIIDAFTKRFGRPPIDVMVQYSFGYIAPDFKSDYTLRMPLPAELQVFIEDFDKGCDVVPFEFNVVLNPATVFAPHTEHVL